MAVTKEMLTQIETEQKKKLEQIEALEREKSIIPYAMANPNASRPAEVYKGPQTMVKGTAKTYTFPIIVTQMNFKRWINSCQDMA